MKELVIVLAGILLLTIGGGLIAGKVLSRNSATQPIAFNHEKHVAFLECTTCHQTVREAAAASIPQAPFCMTCHASPVTKSPEAAKIKDYAEAGEDIPWVRLFDLADHAVFSHKPHVGAGVGCATCHGNVAQTELLTSGFGRDGVGGRYGNKLMNWCRDCHRAKATEGLVPQWLEKPSLATDCLTCHK